MNRIYQNESLDGGTTKDVYISDDEPAESTAKMRFSEMKLRNFESLPGIKQHSH